MSTSKSYNKLLAIQIQEFQTLIWTYYQTNKRPMAFRDNPNPYWVTVSELMLQQTQVSTVLRKFSEFIDRFPSFEALAKASLSDVLVQWLGLGYNRRAKFLHQIAQKVVTEYGGELPLDPEELIKLPGIGKGTAGSIYVFVTNQPCVFIETNVRRVMIHHFFSAETSSWRPDVIVEPTAPAKALASGTVGSRRITDNPSGSYRAELAFSQSALQDDVASQTAEKIHDTDIYPYIEATLDRTNPREWYYALMDYGTYLAKSVPNPNRRSKHYNRQSQFEGSVRQVRGQILKALTQEVLTMAELRKRITGKIEYFESTLEQLRLEGFVQVENEKVSII